MGRIKREIVNKPDRAMRVQNTQPSMRRLKRMYDRGTKITRGMKLQHIEARVWFFPKRKKKHTMSAPLSSVRGRKLIGMANDGAGRVEIKPKKTIWHDPV